MKLKFQHPSIKLYWNTHTLIHLHTVSGCFCEELRNCHRNHMSHRAPNSYYAALYRERLPLLSGVDAGAWLPPFKPNIYSPCCCSAASVVSHSLGCCGLQPTRLLCPWGSPGKNTGIDCYALLQGIFLTQGLNPSLMLFPHCRRILCYLAKWTSCRTKVSQVH